jgi:hypothetical protein
MGQEGSMKTTMKEDSAVKDSLDDEKEFGYL